MPREQVFISYSHKDKKWRDDLNTHLKPYLRGGSIVSWSDQQIAPGSEWFKEIQAALANSRVAVLLVSPDFLASDFIHEHELSPSLKEAEQGGVRILWVPVRESAYKQTPLKKYHAVLDPGKPLARMTKARRDQAWVKICEEIEKAINPSLKDAPPQSAPPTVEPPFGQKPELPREPATELPSSKPDEAHTPDQDANSDTLVAPSEANGNELLGGGTSSYNHGHKLLIQALPQESVRFLEHDAEVHEWVNFDNEVYKPGVITYKLLRGWWSKYNKGAIGLFKNNRIDAIFAIWPIKRETFKEILAGRKFEKQIGPRDILAEPQSKRCRTWYVSGFAVRQNLRSTLEVGRFLRKAIEKWKSNESLSFPLELCAFGYSPEGERSLRRFGFCSQTLASKKGIWPVFRVRIVDRQALQKSLSRIKIRR